MYFRLKAEGDDPVLNLAWGMAPSFYCVDCLVVNVILSYIGLLKVSLDGAVFKAASCINLTFLFNVLELLQVRKK